jgi:uncharacterized protein YndB with AHSA1/START domain
MTAAASSTGPAPTQLGWDGGDLIITRVFGAPRELVFRAWTEAEHFARWWGPHGSTLPFCRLDPRPGGTLHYQHHFPDYPDVWIRGTYRDVTAPERISFITWFSDAAGNRVERPGFPGEMLITIDLDDHPDGTRVSIRHTGLTEDQGEVQGWTESLDRLATLLAVPHNPEHGRTSMIATTLGAGPAPASTAPDNREAVATRVFDARRELVFRAMTEPEHVVRWYGPRDTQLSSCEIDLRPGGRFRFVMAGPEGTEFAFSGEYLEVEPPARIVNTWCFEPFPDSQAIETATWDEEDGRTTVRMSILFQSPEDYAGWAGSGAFGGWAETLDRLAETIAELSAARA